MKDYSVSGDYNEDGVLLSFCPRCGRMYRVTLSKNKRKVIAIRLAMKCSLDFDDTKKVVVDAPKENFLHFISMSLKIVKEDILAVIEDMKEQK